MASSVIINKPAVEADLIRILLVEDTPGDVMMLGQYLRQVRNLKFQLSHAGRLDAMTTLLREETFDVLVLDLNLPDSQGLDTVTHAMEQAPWIPIIVLSSMDNEDSGMEAVRCGAQDYLVKGEIDGWLLARTIRYAIERKRIQGELQHSMAIAGEAQRALLPLRCPSKWTHFKATARNQMCGSIGGDFYDFVSIDENQVAVCIGDVMGHDVRAALLMTQILGILRSEQRNRTIQVVSDLNRSLLALGDKIGTVLTCSLLYAILDAPSGAVFFVNAGHPPPYIYDPQDGKIHQLGSIGMLLGVQQFEGVETCSTLCPGARMVLYTDGILDACNKTGERFGSRRLEDAIRNHAAQTLDESADSIIAEVSDFRDGVPPMDDESVVVVDRL